MVGSGVLVGLFLVSLLFPAVEAGRWPEVEKYKNLTQIISFLNKNYLDGDHFAMAINIPAQMCSAGVKPDWNFLPTDPARKVKRAMNSAAGVYKGRRLISAKLKTIPGTSGYPPEYLLMIQSNPPNTTSRYTLLKKLLNKDKHGCVVFYTYSSPCVNNCSIPDGSYSIAPALEMLRMHKGPKAFVFRRVRKHDVSSTEKKENSKDLPFAICVPSGGRLYVWIGYQEYFPQQQAEIREVNAKVPIYNCDGDQCEYCIYNGREVDLKCMINSQRYV